MNTEMETLYDAVTRLMQTLMIEEPPAFALTASLDGEDRKERARMTATRRKTPPTSGSGASAAS